MRLAWLVLMATVLAGCAKPAPEVAVQDGVPGFYERVRSARYQIGAAAEALFHATSKTDLLAAGESDDTREALMEVRELTASAGARIADYGEPPLAKPAFEAALDAQRQTHRAAIEACKQALTELEEAKGLLQELLQSEPPEEAASQLRQIEELVGEAVDALTEASKD